MRAGFFNHYEPGNYISATANSSGVAQGYLGPCPAGYLWYVERMTTWSNTAKTAPLCEVFVQSVATTNLASATAGDRAGRQDLSLIAANDKADEFAAIVVPENYYLVALWTGLNSGDLVNLSTQICVHQLALSPITTPQDFEAIKREGDIHADEARRHLTPAQEKAV